MIFVMLFQGAVRGLIVVEEMGRILFSRESEEDLRDRRNQGDNLNREAIQAGRPGKQYGRL